MNALFRRRATRLSKREPEPRRVDGGFGLIEIVISMMLLAILATALLPILVQGLKQAASNSTLASATQLANDELERLRTWTACSDLVADSFTTTDARGVILTTTTTVGACSATAENPESVPVTVSVTRGDTGVIVTNTTTYLFISGP